MAQCPGEVKHACFELTVASIKKKKGKKKRKKRVSCMLLLIGVDSFLF